jgi:hypothetical protein
VGAGAVPAPVVVAAVAVTNPAAVCAAAAAAAAVVVVAAVGACATRPTVKMLLRGPAGPAICTGGC